MCLAVVTNGKQKSNEWLEVYKVLIALPNRYFESPRFRTRSFPYRQGEVIKDGTRYLLATEKGVPYESGFHCFENQLDAVQWIWEIGGEDYCSAHKVFVRRIVATGYDHKSRPVTVAREMYIPFKDGDKPCV